MAGNVVLLATGTRLGPYEIGSPLGAGGMGEVYRAVDTRLHRTVAIKILAPQLADDPLLRERFEQEARAVSQLNHPHICILHDVGTAPAVEAGGSDLSYLVMEFVEGETLEQRLTRGALPLDQALELAVQIGDALDKAHRKGIVHRDLKPGNIMLTRTGAKLLDFGLAVQQQQPGSPTDSLTRTSPLGSAGTVLGTLQYLAPEQLEGRDADARSDIFAFGAVLYEMIAGHKAFDGHSQAGVIAAIMRHDPPPLSAAMPTVPPLVDRIVSSCLAKDPNERWQNAADLTRALQWAARMPAGDGVTPSARPQSWAWAAVAALVLLVVGAVAMTMMRRPAAHMDVSRTSVLLPEGVRFPGGGAVGGVGRFAISPDGRRIAFVAIDPNGNQMLWIRPLDSMAAAPISGTDGASSPFWSPDSRSIAFIAQGQLKTVDPGGGSPVVVAPQALNATGAWNSANVILFTPTAGSPLYEVPASGGTPRPVTTLDKRLQDVVHRSPAFLPDGRSFLFVAVSSRTGGTTGARAVYAASLDGGDAKLVLDVSSTARYAQGHVIYMRDNMLMAQPFDASRLATTGEARPIAEQVELAGPASAAFAVSDSGVLAYQPASGSGSQLVWFDREGRELGVVGEPANYGDVELSPDGRRVAVSVLDSGPNTRDLWIVDIARGVRSRFTFDRAEDVAPVWSADGSMLAFTSNRRGHFDLYEKASSGVGSDMAVASDTTEKYPSSGAPNPQFLLYTVFDAATGGPSLWRLPWSGARVGERVLSGVGPGHLSPDGRWFAYASAESGRSEVYAVRFPEGTGKVQVSTAGGSLPRWRHDGREIFYVARDNKLMGVTITSERNELEMGMAHPLFDARPVGPRSFYDVSPDGRGFLVNVLRGESLSSSITVVQNWTAALGS